MLVCVCVCIYKLAFEIASFFCVEFFCEILLLNKLKKQINLYK
jgi:hypothetical protein